MKVVGCAPNAGEGLRTVIELKPDLGIFDLGLPDHSGFWLIREVRKIRSEMPILVLSMHTEPEIISSVIKTGANGYVNKAADSDELNSAVAEVMNGNQYLPRGVAEQIQAMAQTKIPPRRSLQLDYGTLLEPREIEVLRLAAGGMNNSELASRLNVSVSTVKSRLRSTFGKLKVDSRTAAVAAAINLGVISENKSNRG